MRRGEGGEKRKHERPTFTTTPLATMDRYGNITFLPQASTSTAQNESSSHQSSKSIITNTDQHLTINVAPSTSEEPRLETTISIPLAIIAYPQDGDVQGQHHYAMRSEAQQEIKHNDATSAFKKTKRINFEDEYEGTTTKPRTDEKAVEPEEDFATVLSLNSDNDESYEILERTYPKKRKRETIQISSENVETTPTHQRNDGLIQKPSIFDFEEANNSDFLLDFGMDYLLAGPGLDEINTLFPTVGTENNLSNSSYSPENSQSIQTPRQETVSSTSIMQAPDTQSQTQSNLGTQNQGSVDHLNQQQRLNDFEPQIKAFLENLRTHKTKQQNPASHVAFMPITILYPDQNDNSVYVCKIENCRAIYHDIELFKQHVNNHMKENSFHCNKPGCFESFGSMCSLRQHIKNDHQNPNNSDS